MALRKKKSQLKQLKKADYYFSLPVFFFILSLIFWFTAQRHVGNFMIDMPYTVLTVSMALSILISLVVYLISLDQTQSKRLSDQLSANKRLNAVLNASGDIVITLRPDGNIIDINHAGKRKLNIFRIESLSLKDLYSEKDEVFIRNTALKTATADGVWQGSGSLKSGNVTIPVSQVLLSHDTEDHTESSFTIIARDITEELKLEEGREQLEQNKDDFLSIAAHQMRTPLGSMKWRLEMLLHGDFGVLANDAKETVSQLIKTNQHMLTLVNNLLDVAFIEERRTKNKPTTIHLPDIIKKVIQELTPEADERGISFTLTYNPKDIPPLFIDQDQLYAVVENLLSNAVKYNIPHGHVTISVRKDGGEIHFEVQDSGIGIPKNEQKNMFLKFFRAPNAVHSDTDGSGLGLYVAKSYIDSWGGTITYSHNMPRGTTFSVRIPHTTA